MARASSAQNRAAIEQVTLDLVGQFKAAMTQKRPWDSIIDFATHPSFGGLRLYPRQHTLLKLIHLETENMTDYDREVIEGWRLGFKDPRHPAGVQEDIWERIDFLKANGYTHFPHVQNIMGRRASKGMIGGVLGAERLGHMVALDNPQEHYGIAEGKALYLHVVATNLEQAKKFLFADVRQSVEQNKWLSQRLSVSKEYRLSLRTPNDLRRIADMRANDIPVDREIASVQALAMSSNSSSGRGGSAFCNMYDEFAHLINGTNGPQTSEAIYAAYQPALDQLGRDALTYIPSSPLTKVGKFYELYTNGRVLLPEYMQKESAGRAKVYDQDDLADELEQFEDDIYANPELLVIQLPSWELYKDWERGKELVGVPFKRAIQYEPEENGAIENKRMFLLEKQDPETFKVERRAQFAEVVGAYLDPEKVDDIFRPFRLKEGEPLRVLERQEAGRMGFLYHGHVDPSKSGANFAVAIGHLETSEIPDEHGAYWNHVVFDFLHVYQPHTFENHTVDYVQIEKDLEGLVGKYRSLDVFSFDQWNCQTEGTFVRTADGLRRIEDIVGADTPEGVIVDIEVPVETKDGIATARQGYKKGLARTLKIRTRYGFELEVTPEHRLWVNTGTPRAPRWEWLEAADIQVGNDLNLRRGSLFPQRELDTTKYIPDVRGSRYMPTRGTLNADLAEAMGFIVAEGHVSDTHIAWSQKDPQVMERIHADIESNYGRTSNYHRREVVTKNGTPCVDYQQHVTGLRFVKQMHALGVTPARSQEKATPWSIFQSPKHVVAAYLRGLYEGDGGVQHFGKNNEIVYYSTTSDALARETQQLLLSVGVLASRRHRDYTYKGETRREHILYVRGPEIVNFAREVGFISDRKKGILSVCLERINSRAGTSRPSGVREKYRRHGEDFWDQIKTIEDSEAVCYDLSVPGPESYIANGVVSHNSVGFIHKLRQVVKKLGTRTAIKEVTFNQTRNKRVAEQFKTALNLGWVHAYKDDFFDDGEGSLLEMELKFLTDKGGKIEKQNIGPVTTKDLADCVMEVTVSLLESQFSRTGDLNTTIEVGAKGGYPTQSPLNPRAGQVGVTAGETLRERLGGLRAGGMGGTPLRSRGARSR